MKKYPHDVDEAKIICALRFRGYEYEDYIRSQSLVGANSDFTQWIRPVVDSLTLHDCEEYNFAAFFALQRYLYKWGGDRLTQFSEHHIAFDFLFLHLYRTDPPPQFANKEYTKMWEKTYKESIEEVAAVIRSSFRRKGRGSKISV